MNPLKILFILMIFGAIAIFGSEIGERLSVQVNPVLVPEAEAIVGRPLTPVSVAGVARRTVRRCAVGVYCSFPGSKPSATLLEKTTAELIHHEKHPAAASYRPEDV